MVTAFLDLLFFPQYVVTSALAGDNYFCPIVKNKYVGKKKGARCCVCVCGFNFFFFLFKPYVELSH